MMEYLKKLMLKYNWKPLWEAVKEPLRLLVLALIVYVIDYVVPGLNLTMEQKMALITTLRFVDKWLHEAGKAQDNKQMKKGLTQF